MHEAVAEQDEQARRVVELEGGHLHEQRHGEGVVQGEVARGRARRPRPGVAHRVVERERQRVVGARERGRRVFSQLKPLCHL